MQVITYSSLISACGKGEQPERAMKVFAATVQQGMWPNAITYTSLISACERDKQPETANPQVILWRVWKMSSSGSAVLDRVCCLFEKSSSFSSSPTYSYSHSYSCSFRYSSSSMDAHWVLSGCSMDACWMLS